MEAGWGAVMQRRGKAVLGGEILLSDWTCSVWEARQTLKGRC